MVALAGVPRVAPDAGPANRSHGRSGYRPSGDSPAAEVQQISLTSESAGRAWSQLTVGVSGF